MILYDKLRGIEEGAYMSYVKIFSRNLPEGAEENHKEPESEWLVPCSDSNWAPSEVPLKAKALPLYATKACRGRGGIAPTHSRPRH
jgi:hypothetical protein